MRHRICSAPMRGVVLIAECSEMALSIGDHRNNVSRQATYPAGSQPDLPASPADKPKDTKAHRGNDLKKQVLNLKRLIEDCDRTARELDLEVKNEEDRLKVYDPADVTYSAYAAATALRRDNLKRSGDELRRHLADAEQQLRELGSIVTP
jgi:hypothetical protein